MSRDKLIDALIGWRYCEDEFPPEVMPGEKEKQYLVCMEYGVYNVFYWCNGWNCRYDREGIIDRDNEIKEVIAWMPIEPPSKAIEGK